MVKNLRYNKKMITTIPADYIMMFITGSLFSTFTFDNIIRCGRPFKNKYFLTLLIFQTLFCMPVALLCYHLYPDWCWMYWIEAGKLSFPVVSFAFLMYYFFSILGYLTGFIIERKKRGNGLRLVGLSLLLFLIFCLLNFKRLFFIGDMESFKNNSAKFLLTIPELSFIVFGGTAIALMVLILILLSFGKELDFKPDEKTVSSYMRFEKYVGISKVKGDILTAVKDSLNLWNGIEYLKKLLYEKPFVIIKANLAGGGKERKGTQTSPEVLSAVIDLIKELKNDVKIYIAESPSIVWWNLEPLLEGSRIMNVIRDKKVEFLNLSKGEMVEQDFGGRLGIEKIHKKLLENPLILDLPVAKTHGFYKMSGALKNMFGILPAPMKLRRYHTKGFADTSGIVFIDIWRNFPPHIVIVDGTFSCEGDGPVTGKAKKTDFILSSNDAISADVVLCKIMGFKKPEKIPYLKSLFSLGFKPEPMVLGENPETLVKEKWKKPHLLRSYSMLKNFLGILKEHLQTSKNLRLC